MNSFFERESGQKSMMRLLAFLGFCLGGVIAVWGMVLITLAVISVIKGSADASALIGSLMLIVSGGIGLVAGGEALKAIQQRSESKDQAQK